MKGPGGGGKSITLKLPPGKARQVEEILQAEGIPLEPCDYAYFRGRAQGCVLTFYKSGKLLLQGPLAEAWALRVAGGLPEEKEDRREFPGGRRPTIGSDESGKGDYFGPLVVAAVYAPPDRWDLLQKAGVQDSKSVSDRKSLTLAGWIEKEFPTAQRTLMPEEYNPAWEAADRNLNKLMARLHGEVLKELLPHLGEPPRGLVLVDKFGPKGRVEDEMGDLPEGVELLQVPRAEVHPVVAAASIVARARFLEGLEECSREAATRLPKGSGPAAKNTAARVVEIGGRKLLAKVAKLHFKITPGLF